MSKDSLFIVIEGLDGSGKTSIARELTYFLQSVLKKQVKLTFEPHDASCGGLFIRQILEKKITDFSPETLMLAFAANRLDHCNREINKWLAAGKDKMVICDRYYLSSLVYQSSEEFSFDHVMNLNQNARKPDLTIFMNVSNEVCYERMQIRNKPQELFEKDLTETREKYFAAIDFLRKTRKEHIEVVDASGTMEEVLALVGKTIMDFSADYGATERSLIDAYKIPPKSMFELGGNDSNVLDRLSREISALYKKENNSNAIDKVKLQSLIDAKFDALNLSQKAAVFLTHLTSWGYNIVEKYSFTPLLAYQLEFEMPGGLLQRGIALLINEPQRYDVILARIANFEEMTDFLFVFSPGPSELVTTYYERDVIKYNNGLALFPATRVVTEGDLKGFVLTRSYTDLNTPD